MIEKLHETGLYLLIDLERQCSNSIIDMSTFTTTDKLEGEDEPLSEDEIDSSRIKESD